MKIGFKRKIINIYIKLFIIQFKVRKEIFGFENATKMFINMDKRCVIPILKKYGATIGKNCDIETPIIFHNCKDFKRLKIGDNCHIGKGCFFDLKEMIEIKNNVTISMFTTFITHIDVGKSNLKNLYKSSSKKIFINDNTYIGARSIILMGTNISKSAFIAAGSLVTKDIPPFALVGGVPAKVIKENDIKK